MPSPPERQVAVPAFSTRTRARPCAPARGVLQLVREPPRRERSGAGRDARRRVDLSAVADPLVAVRDAQTPVSPESRTRSREPETRQPLRRAAYAALAALRGRWHSFGIGFSSLGACPSRSSCARCGASRSSARRCGSCARPDGRCRSTARSASATGSSRSPHTPELCAEVTLQPVRRHDVDAAVMFADIMTPVLGMGLDVDLVEGVGPVVDRAVRTLADVERSASRTRGGVRARARGRAPRPRASSPPRRP